MAIDYKKELEDAARTMILVHEPDTLIKMIVRRIVKIVKVEHAGILLHHKDKDTYVLTVSRGAPGLKIPAGFARMDADNSLIRFFRERMDKRFFNDGALVYGEAKKILRKNIGSEVKKLLKGVLYQMEIFESVVCIPSYFREDLLGMLLLGAKKSGRSFAKDELDFFVALASDVAMAIRNAQLFRELELELDKKHRLFIHTTIALAAAIDAKDHYTHGHTARVTDLSLKIAKRLSQKNKKAFDEKFLEHLHIAGLLHDIGKIGISESILNKNGPLNEEEKKRMQEHPSVGATILQPIKELEDAILGVKHHHEKYDGSGYPEGLKGDQIPLSAAIISVADTFDAMVTDRPYRNGLSKKEAVQEIQSSSGRQFDPQIASVLAELFQENKI
jgi:HD-GYP domain-containing protein (c-di-GMP phosphodiesterase class II)